MLASSGKVVIDRSRSSRVESSRRRHTKRCAASCRVLCAARRTEVLGLMSVLSAVFGTFSCSDLRWSAGPWTLVGSFSWEAGPFGDWRWRWLTFDVSQVSLRSLRLSYNAIVIDDLSVCLSVCLSVSAVNITDFLELDWNVGTVIYLFQVGISVSIKLVMTYLDTRGVSTIKSKP